MLGSILRVIQRRQLMKGEAKKKERNKYRAPNHTTAPSPRARASWLQVLSQFPFQAISGMISLCDLWLATIGGDTTPVSGRPFPEGDHAHGVRCMCAYPLSYRARGRTDQERGVPVDHATVQPLGHQVQSAAGGGVPPPQAAGRAHWRMDETYIRVKGDGAICIARWITRPDN